MDHTSTPEHIQRTLDCVVNPVAGLACGCVGPQGDEPVCPCAMVSVIRWRGEWIQLTTFPKPEVPKDYLKEFVPVKLDPNRLP